jgi:hypothetical protein
MKAACEVLRCFLEVAEAARDGEFYVRCAQRKAYLTRDVIERWHIGKSPTLGQCKASGLTEAELETVGLYVQRDHGNVMFFRDCMLFPYYENSRVVWFSSRRLVDHDPRTGEAISKAAKALSMRAPDARGYGGVTLDTGFNVDAIATSQSIMLVEGCLDAIVCTERGHSAVAFVGKSPRPGLIAKLRASNAMVYLALDGTADVTLEERLNQAALMGPECWICELPAGKDPDDLDDDALRGLKASAKGCLEAWIDAFKTPPGEWKCGAVDAFRAHLRRWLSEFPTQVSDLRARVCGALGLSAKEWEELLLDRKDSPKTAHKQREISDSDRAFLDSDLKGRLAEIQPLNPGVDRDEAINRLLGDLSEHMGAASAVVRERVRNMVCDTLRFSKSAFDSGIRETRSKQGLACGKNEVNWMSFARRFLDELDTINLAG